MCGGIGIQYRVKEAPAHPILFTEYQQRYDCWYATVCLAILMCYNVIKLVTTASLLCGVVSCGTNRGLYDAHALQVIRCIHIHIKRSVSVRRAMHHNKHNRFVCSDVSLRYKAV